MEATVRGGGARSDGISLRRLLWVGPLAGLVAAVLNAMLYGITTAAGLIPAGFEAPNGGVVGLGAVVSTSFVAALLGAAFLAVLGWLTRRPVRNFRVVAVVLLVLSFLTPFSLPGAPATLVAVLLLMHAIAAVSITGVLTTLARR